MYCKRLDLMLSEAHKVECSRRGHKDEGTDVTFSIPGAAAAGMADATVTEPSPQQSKQPGVEMDGAKSRDPEVEDCRNNGDAAPPSMSNHNNGNEHNNGKGEDQCSKDVPQGPFSPA